MKSEERIEALEQEVSDTVEEVKMILLEIRSFLSENSSPLRSQTDNGKNSLLDSSEKGVNRDGS